MGIKICPQCGGKVSDTRNDCPHCNYIFPKLKKCPDCEEQIDDSLSECPICGHIFAKETNEQPALTPQDKQTPQTPQIAPTPTTTPQATKSDNETSCPYCNSTESIEIGNGLYLCAMCRNKFLDTNGLPTPPLPSTKIEQLMESTEEAIVSNADKSTKKPIKAKMSNKKKWLIIIPSIAAVILICSLIPIIKYSITSTNTNTNTNQSASQNTSPLKFTKNSDGTYQVTDCNSSDYEITIPETYQGGRVTSIGDYAFRDCTSLKNVNIPNSITNIGDHAFRDCTSLTSVTIPDSVTSIGDLAFYDCTSLTSIIIPDSVTSIGGYAFYHCPIETARIPIIAILAVKSANLKTAIITSGDCIPNSAFAGCINLTSVTLPNSVTIIDRGAFSNCTSLTSITLPNSVTNIEPLAFYNCTSLTSVIIPDSVIFNNVSAFYECPSLTLYCEASSQPSSWHISWNENERPVYWAGEWEYDANGNPVPLQS